MLVWPRGATHVLEEQAENQRVGTRNPFDGIFHKITQDDQTCSVVYSEYLRNVFQKSPVDVALFVDRGLASASTGLGSKQHLFLPFFGGPDDRLALRFLTQICQHNGDVSATVIRISKSEGQGKVTPPDGALATVHHAAAAADTVYGQHSTETRLASDTADNIIWQQYSSSTSNKIVFSTETTPEPLHTVVSLVNNEVAESASSGRRTLIVFAGRSRRMAVESLAGELKKLSASTGSTTNSSVPKTLGDVGAAIVAAGVGASLLVIQAAS